MSHQNDNNVNSNQIPKIIQEEEAASHFLQSHKFSLFVDLFQGFFLYTFTGLNFTSVRALIRKKLKDARDPRDIDLTLLQNALQSPLPTADPQLDDDDDERCQKKLQFLEKAHKELMDFHKMKTTKNQFSASPPEIFNPKVLASSGFGSYSLERQGFYWKLFALYVILHPNPEEEIRNFSFTQHSDEFCEFLFSNDRWDLQLIQFKRPELEKLLGMSLDYFWSGLFWKSLGQIGRNYQFLNAVRIANPNVFTGYLFIGQTFRVLGMLFVFSIQYIFVISIIRSNWEALFQKSYQFEFDIPESILLILVMVFVNYCTYATLMSQYINWNVDWNVPLSFEEYLILGLNYAANGLLPCMAPFVAFALLTQSDNVAEIVLNSVAVFFIYEMDDILLTEGERHLLEKSDAMDARIFQVYLNYLVLKQLEGNRFESLMQKKETWLNLICSKITQVLNIFVWCAPVGTTIYCIAHFITRKVVE